MVSDPFLVGVFFGLVPGFGFLYILLHRYEGLFSERRAFFAFFVGFGAGLIATLLQLFLGPSAGTGLALIALYPVLFGTINALLIAMVLNSKRYRGQREAPFYGVGLGLGFGAMNVLFLIGNAVRQLDQSRAGALVDALSLSLIGLYFIGSLLVHAASGAWIGRGVSQQNVLPDLLRAIIAEAVYLVGFFLLFVAEGSRLVPPLALGASIALIAYVLRDVLDHVVPPEIRRELDIHRRRLARDVIRQGQRPNENDPAEARTPGSPEEGAPPPAPPSS